MRITRIISSGTAGAESAALDAAIRFRIPYGGFTTQGSLIPGDRPAARYRLDERPFVDPMLLMRGNLERADGLLVFTTGPLPGRIDRLMDHVRGKAYPCLHMDFALHTPHQAAFRIDAWATAHHVSEVCITGTAIREDRRIYRQVHDAMTAFFLLTADAATPRPERILH
jgi:hypothetical protein